MSYSHNNTKSAFRDVDLSFAMGKYGLMGPNGVGKTTLLRLIAHELVPDEGDILAPSDVLFIPTVAVLQNENWTVERFLGAPLEDDFATKLRLESTLVRFGLENLDMERELRTLSGGQVARLCLAMLSCTKAAWALLDEPSNHLDVHARKLLIEILRNANCGIILCSHEADILRVLDKMVVLSSKGASFFGGSFDECVEYMRNSEKSLAEAATSAELELERRKRAMRKALERSQVSVKQSKYTGGMPRILFGTRKNQAEQSSGRGKLLHASRVQDAQEHLSELREKIPRIYDVKINLPETRVPAGKTVLRWRDVNIIWAHEKTLWEQALSFDLVGSTRLGLVGPNGSGKTALLKALAGIITESDGPDRVLGNIERFVDYAYLDQFANFDDPAASMLTHFSASAPQLHESERRTRLGRIGFEKDDQFRAVGVLSDGERLRLKLTILLSKPNPPKLLLLDEPTNHLDERSKSVIIGLLRSFQGAFIAASHDEAFLNSIEITDTLQLDGT
jgi:ATPase subunit of ABC transporter with duplicated ATPase domains